MAQKNLFEAIKRASKTKKEPRMVYKKSKRTHRKESVKRKRASCEHKRGFSVINCFEYIIVRHLRWLNL